MRKNIKFQILNIRYQIKKRLKSEIGPLAYGRKLAIIGNPHVGFTLMELLIYITLVSVFITDAIIFSWDIMYGREKANSQKIVEQNARIPLARIIYEIKKAKNIQSISGNKLELNNTDFPATIENQSGVLKITDQGQATYNLTSNQIRVLSPPEARNQIFTNLSSADTNSKNIAVNLTIRPKNEFSGQFQAVSTMSASVELNGQFNQARSLLIDASNTVLANSNMDITNTYLQNAGSSNITVAQVSVSWTGGPSGNKLTQIVIGGTTWNGNDSSPTTANIADILLTAGANPVLGAAPVPVDRIRFSKDISTTTNITIGYIMADGSVRKVVFNFANSL